MKQVLNRLFSHQHLDRSEAKQVLTRMADGEYNEAQIAAFISVYLMRSISIEEFLGFTEALLDMRVNVDALSVYDPIDIVGTGGDDKNTFNISTLSCFTVAAAGYKVAKHGNYGATSVSGASTVMEQHGIKFTADVSKLEKSLDEVNIAFLHAPLFNNALKVVAPIRKALGVRTFFNMLGPVVNPIRPKKNVLGVFNLKMLRMYQYIYQQMPEVNFTIVHNLDGYDEISLTDTFKVVTNTNEQLLTPESIGFSRLKQSDLELGSTAEHAAKIFDDVISNQATDAQKNAVIVNSAFAIQTIDRNKPLAECISEARETIESGKLKSTFEKFVKLNS